MKWAILFLCICSSLKAEGTFKLPTPSGQTLVITRAQNKSEQTQGFMHRKSIDPNEGILFNYAKPQKLCFWMKSTHIPLDVLFMDAKGKILEIKSLKPMDETAVCSDKPASYALEISAGAAEKFALKIGHQLPIAPKEQHVSSVNQSISPTKFIPCKSGPNPLGSATKFNASGPTGTCKASPLYTGSTVKR